MGTFPLDSSKKSILLLIGAWVALGLFGHGPWKPDEAYSFGLVYHILQTGDWVVPTLAGEPFMEKPPLFFITAALFAKLFGWAMPLHDAARIATGFYVGLTLLFSSLTAKKLFGEKAAIPTALLLTACLGYVQHAHLLITDNALVAGIAVGLLGFSYCLEKPKIGGILLGTGAGIAFMSKGLLGPGLLGLTAVALLAFPAWRQRNYLAGWAWALLAVAPWLLIWPWLLWQRSPALFEEWLWVQNLGRFSGAHEIGGTPDHWHYLKALPWFALPAWPLAAWTLFHEKSLLKSKPELQLPLTTFVVMFVVLSASALARQLYALPMLLPLCLLAAGSLDALPVWLRRPLDAAALWGAALLGLAAWLLWIAYLAGWPAGIAARVSARFWGHVPSLHVLLLVLAVALSAGWIHVIRKNDLALRWAAGVTLLWGLAMTLWLPPIDYGKTYRDVIAAMRRSLPPGGNCIAARDLTEPQRAAFHYYAGIVNRPASAACPLLLVHTSSAKPPAVEASWTLLWNGARPGDDDREHFWLFSSSAPPPRRP
jgi:4-amino-4-deoxy-L-arabinose transferase-like glycosyltransferase